MADRGAPPITKCQKIINTPDFLEKKHHLKNIIPRKIPFYKLFFFVLLPFTYPQPPYSPEKQPLELYLMSFGKIDLNQVFDTVASRIHQKVYGVE